MVDVVQVLTDRACSNRYGSDLKRKLAQEAGLKQPYEKIVRLKWIASDSKQRGTDCATAETLLHLVHSIPSPKAEPIKLWLAKVDEPRACVAWNSYARPATLPPAGERTPTDPFHGVPPKAQTPMNAQVPYCTPWNVHTFQTPSGEPSHL